MAVRNVQDVMLAAVAVSGMKGEYDMPAQSVPEVSVQEADTPQTADISAARVDQEQDVSAQEGQAHHEQLNEIMRNINVDLQFQYHKEVNFMSVRMLDKKTGEVLREVPPEAMVEHMIKVHDWIGAFLDKTA